MTEKPAKKKRIRNPELTREKLLKSAVDLLAEKGVEALAMKEVAAKAEVSRSVAYMHFADRDDLLRATKAWLSESLQEGVDRFEENTSLYERIKYTTELVLKNFEASRIMMVDAMAGGDLGLHDPLFETVQNRLATFKENDGLRADFDLEILTCIHLGGSIASALLLRQHHKDEDIEQLAARFSREWSRILVNGMFNRLETGVP